MGIYTKTGDKGATSLYDGTRVSKGSAQVHTYGTVDELNAHISLCAVKAVYPEVKELLKHLSWQLFLVAAEVATTDMDKLRKNSTLVSAEDVAAMEEVIDRYTAMLPPVNSFLFLGSSEAGAELNVARTVVRRAERFLVNLEETKPLRAELKKFMNRTSDFLYILARMEDFQAHISKVTKEVMARYTSRESKELPVETKRVADIYERIPVLQQRAVEKATELGVPVVISVVDKSGNLVFLYRMEGSLLISLEISPNKAYTAVALKSPTHLLTDAVQPGAPLYQIESFVDRKIVTFGGGYPLLDGNEVIGGFGISGGSVEEDMLIAEYALRG